MLWKEVPLSSKGFYTKGVLRLLLDTAIDRTTPTFSRYLNFLFETQDLDNIVQQKYGSLWQRSEKDCLGQNVNV